MTSSGKQVTVTVNGQKLAVPEGYPVIQAALDHGIVIPHYCYHPDIGIDGNCRMCLGELEGAPKLVATCTLRAAEGMVVNTRSDRVKDAVRATLEFILVNHPIDCPVCDQAGECKLQDYYFQFGMHRSKVPLVDKVDKAKVVDLGKMIVLDAERCVLCSRCTRFTDRVSGSHELRFKNRGNHTEIVTFDRQPLESNYSGNLADLCPVGALTSKDFRFKKRVWFLKSHDSVCDGCSTGCSMRIDADQNQIYRYVPRRNSFVNASWMCDEGRMSYKEVGAKRLTDPKLRESSGPVEIPWEKALDLAAKRLREASQGETSVYLVATPAVTTEELYLAKRFAHDVLETPHVDFRVASTCESPDQLADSVLLRHDRYPSSRAAQVLGLVPGADGVALANVTDQHFKVVYVLAAHRLVGDRLDSLRRLCEAADFVIMHAAQECDLLEVADLVLPVSMMAEKSGTLVNYAGRLQRLEKAVEPPGEAEPDGRVLCLMAEKLGRPLGADEPAAVFLGLAGAVSAMKDLSWDLIGPTGVQLSGFPVARPEVAKVSPAPQLAANEAAGV